MIDYLSMFMLRHTGLAVLALSLLMMGFCVGAVLCAHRFRFIRELRQRATAAEKRVQELLTRIEDLTKDAPDVAGGHPYRTAAKTDGSVATEEKVTKTEEKKDPRFDNHGRLRWRSMEEFKCHVCGSTECEPPNFEDDSSCKYKHTGRHVHVSCKQCSAVLSYGIAHDKPIYRSDIQPKDEKKEEGSFGHSSVMGG
jgi:hypothetical protein